MINLDWFKTTGLLAAQSASHAFLGVSGGDVFNVFHIDWRGALGIAGGAAMAAVLHQIIAYRIADKTAAVVSGQAIEDAAAALSAPGKIQSTLDTLKAAADSSVVIQPGAELPAEVNPDAAPAQENGRES